MFTKPGHLFFIENVQAISPYIERGGDTERQRDTKREEGRGREGATETERKADKICAYEQQLHFLNVFRECYNYCMHMSP